ncbi:MAG: 50S ribosomal protein L11 methyltransferase [Myxococcales bacterium]|nr:50S ribosomal protein L11 methyltransferase [Myxococcales bacterium]
MEFFVTAVDFELVREGDDLIARAGGAEVRGGPELLLTLERFSTATPRGDAAPGFFEPLRAAGLLLPVEQVARDGGFVGFDAPTAHTEMLNDAARTTGFVEAIRRVVRPDDVVVDLGTGTGVLAVAAARAGARRVYAIEAGDVASLAQQMAEFNGVSDRVEVIRGWSTAVALPELATVLVSETIGDEPLGERVLESLLDARRRLMTPDARLIPRVLRLWGDIIQVPDDELEKWTFTAQNTRRWSQSLGLNLSPLTELALAEPHALKLPACLANRWQRLAPSCLLATIPLDKYEALSLDTACSCAIAQAGVLNGLAVWAELELAPGITVTTGRPDPGNSWRLYVHRVPERHLSAGQQVVVRYRYGHDTPRVEVRDA